jgi:hypothetical protein
MMVMDYQLVLLSHFFGWHLRVVLFLRKGGDGEAERSDGRQDNSKFIHGFSPAGGESTCFFVRRASSLYFCTNPLSRSSEAGSDAVSINMRSRSARARQYSVRSILGLSDQLDGAQMLP